MSERGRMCVIAAATALFYVAWVLFVCLVEVLCRKG